MQIETKDIKRQNGDGINNPITNLSLNFKNKQYGSQKYRNINLDSMGQ